MRNKSALVTGATGFIGQTLTKHLYNNGFKIRSVTRNLNHAQIKQSPEYEWIQADITQPETLKTLCLEVDYVFHLAGFSHAWQESTPNYAQMQNEINLHGTLALAQIAKKSGVKRFIFFSTIKACADDENGCIDENWTERPGTIYGNAKRLAEEELLNLSQDASMDVIILRPSLVYGPGWKGNLAAMLAAVDKGYFPPPPSNIVQKKSMISTYDLCEAARLAAVADLPQQRVYIVEDGIDYNTYQIYQWMRVALGKKSNRFYFPLCLWKILAKLGDVGQYVLRRRLPINTEAVKKLFDSSCYRSAYLRQELDFVPKYTFEQVLPEIIKAYKE